MVYFLFQWILQETGISIPLCGIITASLALSHWTSFAATAQVTPDGTLPTTVTSSDGLNVVINGGVQSGANLFHSFDEFSIPTDGSATFNNAVDIGNIIGRITGNTVSTIDGGLQAQGSTNVFLLNPNGFVFGPNADLNIGGSFLATTADRFLFEDGAFFSASNPQAFPLLAIRAPLGLQMGQAPGAISVQGNGHSLVHTIDYFPVQNAASAPPGLQVNSGETLALLGSGLRLDASTLTAPGGHVELGSVAKGRIYFDDAWQFDYGEANDFQDIRLSQRSLLDVGDRQAGSVHLYGSTVQLESGATILSQQTGPRRGGRIALHGTDAVFLQGTAPGGTPRTQIRMETTGSGPGSSIRIFTPTLRLRGGSAIVATTFGDARAGTIHIRDADRIKIAGYSALAPDDTTALSAIATLSVGDRGNAGPIRIATEELTLNGGGSLVSLALLGRGNGGNINIDASAITVQDLSPRSGVAGISSATIGQGNAGDINIQTDSLLIRNGALVDSSSIAEGNAGNIRINATEHIHVEGFVRTGLNTSNMVRSSINSVTSSVLTSSINLPGIPDTPTGNAGRIQIKTPTLIVANRGQVSIGTDGPGDSGEIQITTDILELNRQGQISAIITTGEGGAIRVQTDHLTLNNGLINASVQNNGQGGDITINATESIDIMGAGERALLTTVVFPAFTGQFQEIQVNQGIWAIASQNGTPGDISLQTNNLSLSNGSVVAAATFGRQPGGAIRVQDTQSIDIQASVLSSSTFNRDNGGDAGEIEIETQQLRIRDGGEIIATTTGNGDGGNVVVNASESILLQGRSALGSLFASGLFADAQGDATGNGGDLQLKTPLLMVQDDAGFSASAGGSLPALDTLFAQPPQISDSRQRAFDIRQSPLGRDGQAHDPPRSIAGSVEAEAGWVLLDQGNITATSNQGEGGNISLDIGDGLLMTRQSSISTRAGTEMGGGGNGGNISIETPFIVAMDNSDIVSNAFDGDGGTINITTQGLFGLAFRDVLTEQSDINASSRFGLSGNVTITTPDVDPASDAVILPTTVVESTQQIATNCSRIVGSRFTITGKSGVPLGPEGSIGVTRPWRDILPDFGQMPTAWDERGAMLPRIAAERIPATQAESIPEVGSFLQEATEMAIAHDGSIQLLGGSESGLETPQPTCSSRSVSSSHH